MVKTDKIYATEILYLSSCTYAPCLNLAHQTPHEIPNQ